MNTKFEGTYGGYTTSTSDFTTSRRTGLERAIAFANAERGKRGNE